MTGFPRKLTTAYLTSDGHAFETEAEAEKHEMKYRLKSAVLRAAVASQFHSFGHFSDREMRRADDRYIANLAKSLIEEGLTFK